MDIFLNVVGILLVIFTLIYYVAILSDFDEFTKELCKTKAEILTLLIPFGSLYLKIKHKLEEYD